jgi:hypothetical protein
MEEIRVLVSHCPGIPTVHSTGRSRRGTGYGFPPAIASTAPAPGRGAGEGRAARAGWGCRRGTYGSPPPGRGKPPPRSPPPVAIPPRSTAQGDPGVEPGPGSHSPPPGNQREDRSRGTAHHRLYARAETHGDVVSRGDTKTMKRRQGQHSPDFASPRAFARRPRSRCHVISDIRSCLVMTPCTFPCSITMTAWL